MLRPTQSLRAKVAVVERRLQVGQGAPMGAKLRYVGIHLRNLEGGKSEADEAKRKVKGFCGGVFTEVGR